mmetsp:Transcript_20147/g.22412  ORF Transcript_20147/g.22412 Transcript_20147/m.22412 type:complete len:319 (+) Transcript_20147:63-1019(+)
MENERSSWLSKYLKLRRLTNDLLEAKIYPWHLCTDIIITSLIVLNTVLYVLATVEPLYEKNQYWMDLVQDISSILFTVEYFIRVWCCIEETTYRQKGVVLGRLRYMVTVLALLDLLAVVPYWVNLIIARDTGIAFISAVRIVRILKLLKIDRKTHAITLLTSVLKNNREILCVTTLLAVYVFIIQATILYMVEHSYQPLNPNYDSIPKVMFIAVLLVTGQGVPEDVSEPGKIVVAISVVLSIAMFAVPAGILSWGFEPVGELFINARKAKKIEKLKIRKMRAANLRAQGYDTCTSSSDSDDWSLHLSSDVDSDELKLE